MKESSEYRIVWKRVFVIMHYATFATWKSPWHNNEGTVRLKFGYPTRRVVVIIAIVVILVGSAIVSFDSLKVVYPRLLHVGDRWTYDVEFPDSSGYRLTETVQQEAQINYTETYTLFNDDPYHTSTTYLWLTGDWRELKTLKPQIGNLNASSVALYQPPIQLIHVPLHVGDRW